jgi:hypothetical protein
VPPDPPPHPARAREASKAATKKTRFVFIDRPSDLPVPMLLATILTPASVQSRKVLRRGSRNTRIGHIRSGSRRDRAGGCRRQPLSCPAGSPSLASEGRIRVVERGCRDEFNPSSTGN